MFIYIYISIYLCIYMLQFQYISLTENGKRKFVFLVGKRLTVPIYANVLYKTRPSIGQEDGPIDVASGVYKFSPTSVDCTGRSPYTPLPISETLHRVHVFSYRPPPLIFKWFLPKCIQGWI
jgi:hypothetical protein